MMMQLKLPKSDKYHWTQHAQYKMQQYGLSPQRVIRVIRNPERVEEGIVPKTIAVMQPASIRRDSSSRGKPASVKYKNFKKTWSQEIWAMYKLCGKVNHKTQTCLPVGKVSKTKQNTNLKLQTTNLFISRYTKKLKIISAWRYPGVSPKNNPIPEEILSEIENLD